MISPLTRKKILLYVNKIGIIYILSISTKLPTAYDSTLLMSIAVPRIKNLVLRVVRESF